MGNIQWTWSLKPKDNQRLTNWDVPHTMFTVMQWLVSAKTLSVNRISMEDRD